MQSSEKIFEKMIGRLYKANTCLSNLIFLPLIFPNFYENICFSFPVFSRMQAESMLLWTTNRTGGASLGMDAPP